MPTYEEIRQLTIRAKSEGVEGLTKAVDELARKYGAAAETVDRNAKSVQSTEAAYRKLEGGLSAAARAQQEFERQSRIASRALETGVISAEKYAEAMRRIHDRTMAAHSGFARLAQAGREGAASLAEMEKGYNNLASRMAKFAATTPSSAGGSGSRQLSRNDMVNLGFQAQDVAVSLAGGMNPLMVAMQQGGQIQGILAQSGVGVGAAVRQVGSAVASAMTPATAGIVAVTAAAVAAGAATARWYSLTNQLSQSLNGLGRMSGQTGSGLLAIAQGAAGRGGLSTAEGMQFAGGFARAGLGADAIGTATASVRDFSIATGQDMPSAAQAMARALQDPTRGAQELAQNLGLLNAGQVRTIQSMQASGNAMGAQALMARMLAEELAKAARNKNAFDEAMNSVGNWISNKWSGLGATFMPSDVQRLQELKNAQAIAPGITNFLSGSYMDTLGKKTEAQDNIAYIEGIRKQREQIGISAMAATTPTDADTLRQMTELATKLQTALDTKGTGLLPEQIATIKQNLEGINNARNTYLSSAQRIHESAVLEVQAIMARTEAERQSVALAQARLDISGQALDNARRAELLAAAEARSAATIQRERDDRTRSAQDQARLVGLTGLPRTIAEIENRYRDLNSPQDQATKATEIASARANAANGLTGPAMLQAQNNLSMIGVQLRTIGASTGQAAAAIEYERLRQQAMQEGIPVTEELSQKFRDIASTAGQAATASEVLQKAQQNQSQTVSQASSIFQAGANAIIQGKNPMQAMGMALGQMLVQKGSDALAESLFGKGGLFGQTVSEMSVNAAMVSINGGTSGVGGLFGGSTSGNGIPGITSPSSSATTSGSPVMDAVKSALGLGGGASSPSRAASLPNLTSDMMPAGIDRSAFAAELANPAIRQRLMAFTQAEVGGQGPQAQQAFMESIFNRASARGQTLGETLQGSYFPSETHARVASLMGNPNLEGRYGGILNEVTGGSNISNYATGNASGTVGFGRNGYGTYAAGGERFGVENADIGWASRMRSGAAPTPGAVSSQPLTPLARTTGFDAPATNGAQGWEATIPLSTGKNFAPATQQMLQLNQTISQTASAAGSAVQPLGGVTNGLGSMTSALTNMMPSFGSMFGGGGGLFGGLFGGGGFADGGWTGTGSRSSPAGMVHGQEFVVKAGPAGRNRAMLEAMNAGASFGGGSMLRMDGSSTVIVQGNADSDSIQQIREELAAHRAAMGDQMKSLHRNWGRHSASWDHREG